MVHTPPSRYEGGLLLMNILNDYDLIASSTYFQPLKIKNIATYCSKEEGAAPSQIIMS